MYTDDKNAQVVLSLLKQYGIKKIVISPGSANVSISRSAQVDSWFELYSVVDERSAAYFAVGLAEESGEPVAISCTGATASRNYLPGLTEAYYRNLPIVAITSQNYTVDYGNLSPQSTDRTVSQNDVKKFSVHLPVVKDEDDLEKCILGVNKALIAATTRGGGPVHINVPIRNYEFTTQELPEVRKISYYSAETLPEKTADIGKVLYSKKVALFIGAHRPFSKNTQQSIERFVDKYNAVVYTDQTSNFNGKNTYQITQVSRVKRSKNRPDLIIDMGSVTGDYSAGWLRGIETWRISEDGEVHDRFHNQTVLFDCSENFFFTNMLSNRGVSKSNYPAEIAKEASDIEHPTTLPLSNTMISQELSTRLPEKSNIHLGILNSLRSMNFFNLDKSIHRTSNVGGFGIDGPLSTLIGQSMVNRKKLTFGLVGDLASFYDMNALGIRHISNNIRILIVNNNGGVEFRLNQGYESQWSTESDEFISARGHNGSFQGWAESMGFEYMAAKTKDEFLKKVDNFCNPKLAAFKKPVLFEVFTEVPDEQLGFATMFAMNFPGIERQLTGPESSKEKNTGKRFGDKIKKAAPEYAKKAYRKYRSRD